MTDFNAVILDCAAAEANAYIVELADTLERDWLKLPYRELDDEGFLCRVLSRALTEISTPDGEQLRCPEILAEISRSCRIEAPGIVSDHAKHKFKIGNMVVLLYRRKKKFRLRVGDPWPFSAYVYTYTVEGTNPRGCSAGDCVALMKAFRDNYDRVRVEFIRVSKFYREKILPKMSLLLEIYSTTESAVFK